MTRIWSSICACVTLAITPSGLTTWKYTGTFSLNFALPLPLADAGRDATGSSMTGSLMSPSPPRANACADPVTAATIVPSKQSPARAPAGVSAGAMTIEQRRA